MTTDLEEALRHLAPVIDAEQARGNVRAALDNHPHTIGAAVVLTHDIDLEALRAELDPTEGHELGVGRGGQPYAACRHYEATVYGAPEGRPSWWARRRRATWWKHWQAGPQTRTPW